MTPTFGKAKADRVGVKRPIVAGRVTKALVGPCKIKVEDLHGEAGGDLEDVEGPGVGDVEGGGVDKDRNVAPVVRPDAGLVSVDNQA